MFFRDIIDNRTKEKYKAVCQMRGKTMTEDFSEHMKKTAEDFDKLSKLVKRA